MSEEIQESPKSLAYACVTAILETLPERAGVFSSLESDLYLCYN